MSAPETAPLDIWRMSNWWKAGNIFLLGHHFTTVCIGLAWFVQPSITLRNALQDPGWGLMWCFLLVAYGVVGFVSRLTERYFMESVAVAAMALALACWAVVIIFQPANWTGLQAGLALFAGAMFRAGWALVQYAWISQPPLVQRIISAVNEQIAEDEKQADEEDRDDEEPR